jgi:hypothetical protein
MVLGIGPSHAWQAAGGGFTPLFNGRDLGGWVNVNCAPETWTVREGVIHCTGKPTGVLRTERMYENFITWSKAATPGCSSIRARSP